MSAFGGKADIRWTRNQCPLLTHSGHGRGNSELHANNEGSNVALAQLSALFHWPLLPAQIKRAVDDAYVTIRLRKISQHASGLRIELLGQETDVVAAREQAFEQVAGLRIAPLQNVIGHQPKAARQKRAFALRQPVGGIVGLVAQNEFAIDQEFVFDRAKCSLDAWIGRGKEADQRNQQQTRIEALEAIGLHEAIKLRIETTLTDFGVNLVGDLTPPLP